MVYTSALLIDHQSFQCRLYDEAEHERYQRRKGENRRYVGNNSYNNVGKFKARLVVRGFKDKKNYEIREVYAPVSRLSVIRAVLAIVNKIGLEIVQLDVKTAFLNGVLDDEIYMEIPDGVKVDDKTRATKVCKLNRALYGLKISPKKWNQRFTAEVEKLGLQRDINEPCLFTYRKLGILIILVLYVDDILLAGNDPIKLKEIIDHLSRVFEMKNLGEPKDYLGMRIVRSRENQTISLNQTEYTQRILERFNMNECRTHDTPMITRQVRSRNHTESQNKIRKIEAPYREAIGSLLYLANVTRPDISYAVNVLSRKQSDPSEEDWTGVKRVFGYLRGTIELSLNYRGKSDELEIHTDASFKDNSDSTSTSEMAIALFGDIIMWRSHKQRVVNSSTCATEYFAMSEACQEGISLDKAIRDVLGRTMYPIVIHCDNKAARDCTQKEGSHKLRGFDDDIETIKSNLLERGRELVSKVNFLMFTAIMSNSAYLKESSLSNGCLLKTMWLTYSLSLSPLAHLDSLEIDC